MEFEHHYTDVNGIRLHYVSSGSPTQPLMLFVHGFPEFWYAWHDQLREFSRDYHAVALDMRGFNLSDKPADVKAYRAKHLVEDLRQLIPALGHQKCILVAHDWGGAAAWNLAAEHPEVVGKLVIINSPHPVTFARALRDHPGQIAASQYMLLFREAKAERVMSANNFERLSTIFKQMGDGDSALTEDEQALYRAAWAQPGALTGGLNYYRASPLYPPSPAGDPGAAALNLDPTQFTVRVPTLILWGERDQALLPVLLDGIEEVVPDVRIQRIPDGSHWVVHEYPEVVNRAIRQFAGA
ncbi:MAG: alpha/beta hydrolase [Proteobacteria bacterium]|nr:alpha/beta hydrolase [Pseudomonadota bacterium]